MLPLQNSHTATAIAIASCFPSPTNLHSRTASSILIQCSYILLECQAILPHSTFPAHDAKNATCICTNVALVSHTYNPSALSRNYAHVRIFFHTSSSPEMSNHITATLAQMNPVLIPRRTSKTVCVPFLTTPSSASCSNQPVPSMFHSTISRLTLHRIPNPLKSTPFSIPWRCRVVQGLNRYIPHFSLLQFSPTCVSASCLCVFVAHSSNI